MNYYEHHLGDYLRDTAHLSMVEDGAYRRLLDAYYIKELPIPAAFRDACRLVRAQTKPERDAVQTVLQEFFDQGPDGWRHKRCDAEIARYQDKQAKAKRSADARWNAQRSLSDGNANASDDGMRTHCEGNALQTPVTSNQSPSLSRTDRGNSPSPAGEGLPLLPGEPETPGIPPCDHQAVLALWRQHMPTNPQPAKWTPTRAKHLQARWRELFADGKAATHEAALAWFGKFFRYLAKSKFLTGRVPPREANRPPFFAELPWVLSPENFVQCIEGKYHPET